MWRKNVQSALLKFYTAKKSSFISTEKDFVEAAFLAALDKQHKSAHRRSYGSRSTLHKRSVLNLLDFTVECHCTQMCSSTNQHTDTAGETASR